MIALGLGVAALAVVAFASGSPERAAPPAIDLPQERSAPRDTNVEARKAQLQTRRAAARREARSAQPATPPAAAAAPRPNPAAAGDDDDGDGTDGGNSNGDGND